MTNPLAAGSRWLIPFPSAVICVLGAALCVSPSQLSAQSVTFDGVQATIGSGLIAPSGVAVDAAGDVFILDSGGRRIVEVPADGSPQKTLALAPSANPYATFGSLTADGAGDVFYTYLNGGLPPVPPYGTEELKAGTVTPTLVSSTVVGNLAADTAGDLFVSNGRVTKFPAGGGSPLIFPIDFGGAQMAADNSGNLFTASGGLDGGLYEVHLSTLAVAPVGNFSYRYETGVAVDGAGNVYAGGSLTLNGIQEVPANGNQQFELPLNPGDPFTSLSLAADAKGNVYVANNGTNQIRVLYPHSVDFGGVNVCPSGTEGPPPCSQTLTLNYTVTASGTLGPPKVLTSGAANLDFTLGACPGGPGVSPYCTCTGPVSAGASCVVNVNFSPRFPGARNGAVQITDASGHVIATTLIYGVGYAPEIAFNPSVQTTLPVSGFSATYGPYAVAEDGAGNLYLAYLYSNTVLKVPPSGGTPTTVGSGMNFPQGVAVDGAGNVFIADDSNYRLVEVPSSGGAQLDVPLTTNSSPYAPTSVAVDGAGNVFMTGGNGFGAAQQLIKLPAGSSSPTVLYDIPSGYPSLTAVAVDDGGNVYASYNDVANNTVLKVSAEGSSALLPFSGLYNPGGVAVDAAGDVLVAWSEEDPAVQAISELPAGGALQTGYYPYGFTEPVGLATDGAGNLFVTDIYNVDPVKLQLSQPAALPSFDSTPVGSATSPQMVAVQNIGNATLTLAEVTVSPNFEQIVYTVTPGESPACAAGLSLAPGATCGLSIKFTPTAGGTLTGSAVLTDNNLNGYRLTQTIALSGTGVGPAGPAPQVSATTLDFGSVNFPGSGSQSLTIKNVGSGLLTVTPSINGPSYTIASSNCGAGVEAGNSCTMIVQYSPVTVGLHDDYMTIATNGTNSPVVALHGKAIGVGATEVKLDFGSVLINNSSETELLIITNYGVPGAPTVTINTGGASYSLPYLYCNSGVAVGQNCTVPVTFAPPSVGTHNDHITVTASNGTVSKVELEGTGSAP